MEVRSKAEAIKDFQRNESDTGSTEVQVAILSSRIKHLEQHLAYADQLMGLISDSSS